MKQSFFWESPKVIVCHALFNFDPNYFHLSLLFVQSNKPQQSSCRLRDQERQKSHACANRNFFKWGFHQQKGDEEVEDAISPNMQPLFCFLLRQLEVTTLRYYLLFSQCCACSSTIYICFITLCKASIGISASTCSCVRNGYLLFFPEHFPCYNHKSKLRYLLLQRGFSLLQSSFNFKQTP